MDCNKCSTVLKIEDSLKCCTCQKHLHYSCAGLSDSDYKKILPMNKTKWKCTVCKPLKKGVSASPRVTPEDAAAIPEVSSIAPMTSIVNIDSSKLFAYMDEKFKSLEKSMLKQITDLEESVKLMSDKYDSVITNIEAQTTKLKTLQVENISLKESVKLLETKVEHLEDNCSKRDQWSRIRNVELVGVPECDTESLPEIVAKVAAYAGVPLQPSEMEFATRVQAKRPVKGVPRAIVVQFRDRATKDRLIHASRQCPGRLTTQDLGMDGEPRKIHVNEHLTVKNKLLFTKCKKAANDKGYKFIWTKNCRIYVRKAEGSPYIHISTESDLVKIE